MRISFVLALPLLAGCASAAEPASEPAPERRPVITRIVTARPSTAAADSGKVAGMRIEMMVDAPCQTNDRMATGTLDFGNVTPMPSAQPPRELPYIPNLCPVTAAPGQKPATPAALQRGPERVREPAGQR